jgi:non-ribosomal peptide synthase protein (TIGR01720 family)
VNVSRTVGWFSAAIPLLLEVQPGGTMQATLRTVEHRLRTLPNEGVGYSVLRHLRQGWMESAVAPPSEVLLNHQGDLSSSDTNRLFATQFDPNGYAEGLTKLNLPWKLAVLSNVADDQLNVHFVSRVYRQETLERIAEEFQRNLRDLIGVSRTVAVAG